MYHLQAYQGDRFKHDPNKPPLFGDPSSPGFVPGQIPKSRIFEDKDQYTPWQAPHDDYSPEHMKRWLSGTKPSDEINRPVSSVAHHPYEYFGEHDLSGLKEIDAPDTGLMVNNWTHNGHMNNVGKLVSGVQNTRSRYRELTTGFYGEMNSMTKEFVSYLNNDIGLVPKTNVNELGAFTSKGPFAPTEAFTIPKPGQTSLYNSTKLFQNADEFRIQNGLKGIESTVMYQARILMHELCHAYGITREDHVETVMKGFYQKMLKRYKGTLKGATIRALLDDVYGRLDNVDSKGRWKKAKGLEAIVEKETGKRKKKKEKRAKASKK